MRAALLFAFLTVSGLVLGAERPIDGPAPPVPPEVIARDAEGRVTLRAVRVDEPLAVDGRLEEAVYAAVPGASGFVQQEPREGAPATEATEVWVFFDRQNVYVAARCWDSRPERIVANEMRRDNRNIFNNDHFAVVLDTFYDRRNGFAFQTNPLGGIWDGQITDERDVNSDWNTAWTVETARFAGGWTVEMAIPFKSLRYKAAGPQLWGINFRRVVRSKNEWSYLTPIAAAYRGQGLFKLSAAATLVGIEAPARSMNLEVKPYATSGLRTDRTADPVVANDLLADAGFDVKYGLTRGLVLDLTYNTDFAQVEDDEQQVNLTRFSLFFPEKREFFLEGQGIFSFGGRSGQRFGGAQDTPILFFSRRIGLVDGESVPIEAGGRLTGRAGPYAIGLLAIRTGASPAAAETTFSVARLKRDVLRRSNVGVIATHRSRSLVGDGANGVFGLDGNFSFYENVNVNAYYARSRTPGLAGRDASYRGRFHYGGDRYGVELERLVVEENFNPEIGFLRRDDFAKSYAKVRFSPRPRSLPGVRKLSYEASLDYLTDGIGRLETRQAELAFRTDFSSGDDLNVEYRRNLERLVDPFEIADGVVVPAGTYRFAELRASYRLGPQRRVSGWLAVETGRFFGGDRTEASYWGRLELSPRLSLEPRIAVNWVDLPAGRFTATLLRVRASYTISPRSFVGVLVQYNSSTATLATNLRFRWEYRPGSDLFVVYSDGRDTLARGFPRLESRSLVVKLTRLVRF